MHQPSLFDQPLPQSPPHNGVDTSRAAADSMRPHAATLRQKVLEHIRHCGEDGSTCDEAELRLGMSHQTCSARFRELAQQGLIWDSGRRRETRTGRGAIVYLSEGKGGHD